MRIDETVRDYNQQFDELMTALKEEAEKSHDFLRYLTFRLDFNAYHAQTTTNTTASTTAATTTTTASSSATATAVAGTTASSSSSSVPAHLSMTLANEGATDRQWKQQQQSRLVSSVRPGAAATLMAGVPAAPGGEQDATNHGFYLKETASMTSSRVPQHHPDTLGATGSKPAQQNRYK